MAYGVNIEPLHQHYIAGDYIQWSETATEVTNGGVYMISAGTAGHCRITNASDATTPTSINGFDLAVGSPLFIYIKAGQFIHFDGSDGTYVRLAAA